MVNKSSVDNKKYDIKDDDIKVTKEDTRLAINYKNSGKKKANIDLVILFYKDNDMTYFANAEILGASPNESLDSQIKYEDMPGYTSGINIDELFNRYEIGSIYSYYYE